MPAILIRLTDLQKKELEIRSSEDGVSQHGYVIDKVFGRDSGAAASGLREKMDILVKSMEELLRREHNTTLVSPATGLGSGFFGKESSKREALKRTDIVYEAGYKNPDWDD